ncbi:hypothetical protein GH714_030304 [Hevea brasiliensis]|uniref:Peptidase C1A papain C-terminal domain-containing protein n=1 Tax=Hevea brasiliensis TaxID=3981 RepID=A0A6A6LQL2_HEVBR|nr:hypothetical protein GH714_030304 [Hevea brasiliensis]
MALRLSFFAIFSLLFVYVVIAETSTSSDGDDQLIRQVVDGQDESSMGPNLLSEEHHFSLFKRKFKKSYALRRSMITDSRCLRLTVRVDRAGVSAPPGPWKALISSPRETLLVLASNSLWIVTMRLCDPEEAGACDSGCNGGLMNSAFEYTLKAGGLMREEDYPYTGTDRGACKFDKTKVAASVANFSVVSLDEDQIAANLVKNGPLAVAINAVFMQTYIGGVSCPYICSKRLDHGVLLVGYGSAGYAPIRMKEKHIGLSKTHGVKTGERVDTTKSAGVAIFVG